MTSSKLSRQIYFWLLYEIIHIYTAVIRSDSTALLLGMMITTHPHRHISAGRIARNGDNKRSSLMELFDNGNPTDKYAMCHFTRIPDTVMEISWQQTPKPCACIYHRKATANKKTTLRTKPNLLQFIFIRTKQTEQIKLVETTCWFMASNMSGEITGTQAEHSAPNPAGAARVLSRSASRERPSLLSGLAACRVRI